MPLNSSLSLCSCASVQGKSRELQSPGQSLAGISLPCTGQGEIGRGVGRHGCGSAPGCRQPCAASSLNCPKLIWTSVSHESGAMHVALLTFEELSEGALAVEISLLILSLLFWTSCWLADSDISFTSFRLAEHWALSRRVHFYKGNSSLGLKLK